MARVRQISTRAISLVWLGIFFDGCCSRHLPRDTNLTPTLEDAVTQATTLRVWLRGDSEEVPASAIEASQAKIEALAGIQQIDGLDSTNRSRKCVPTQDYVDVYWNWKNTTRTLEMCLDGTLGPEQNNITDQLEDCKEDTIRFNTTVNFLTEQLAEAKANCTDNTPPLGSNCTLPSLPNLLPIDTPPFANNTGPVVCPPANCTVQTAGLAFYKNLFLQCESRLNSTSPIPEQEEHRRTRMQLEECGGRLDVQRDLVKGLQDAEPMYEIFRNFSGNATAENFGKMLQDMKSDSEKKDQDLYKGEEKWKKLQDELRRIAANCNYNFANCRRLWGLIDGMNII